MNWKRIRDGKQKSPLVYKKMAKSIKVNYFYNLLYQMVALLVPFITAPYVSRVLEADGIGKYSYYSAIVYYFMLFANLGIGTYGQIEIAKVRDNQEKTNVLFSELLAIKIVLGVICSIVFFISAVFVKEKILYLVLYFSLLGNILDIGWFFTGIEDFKKISIRSMAMRILNVVCLFLFIHKKEDLILYVVLNSLLSFLGTAVLWIHLGRYVQIHFRKLNMDNIKLHMHGCFIFFLPTVANSLYTVFSKTLLGFIGKSDFENGYYEQSYRLVTIVMAFLSSLFGILCARISFLYAINDEEAVQKNIALGLNYTFFLAFPIVAGILVVAENFICWFLGEAFSPAIPIMQVFSFIVFAEGLSDCLGSVFYNPTGRRWLSCKLLFVGSGINLVANVCFIPKFHALGAAISTTLAAVVVCILYVAFSVRHIQYSKVIQTAWRYPLSAFIMYVLLRFLTRYINMTGAVLTIIQIVSGCIIYFLMLIVLRDPLLKMLLQRKKSGENK